MNESVTNLGEQDLSAEERALLDEFLSENQLFYGPDPDIMRDHGLAPRTPEEETLLNSDLDVNRMNLVRGRIESALEEGFNMVEQMGVAPGAKWGDLVTAIFTTKGDMAQIAPSGIGVFASVCQYPIKFINKYWTNEPTVGVKEGDVFITNDSRFGHVHTADQSLLTPLFHQGTMVCWLSTTIHEGENGSTEPGGLPSTAESKYDEGLTMCPFKCAENFELKRDLVNFLQNSVRDPKTQMADMKVKLHTLIRLRERILTIIDEFGPDYLVATVRKTLEDTEAEVRRRIGELPDGTVRLNTWIDGSLREHILAKIPIAITVKDERMIYDLRGACPELVNRSINTQLNSFKTCMSTNLILYVWPDLPVNQAVFSAIEVLTDRNSLVDAGPESPNAMSLIPLFRACTAPSVALAKLYYALPKRYTAINAFHYNQPATFVYGGLTQHGEFMGNFCADINGNGCGAREDNDGEHAMSPCFGAVADTGENELAEEELPYVRLIAQQLAKDRIGFGKYRGGQGYEQMITVRESNLWGFMTGQVGAKFPSALGLFGGYGCPAYPLGKIKGINIFDVIAKDPEKLKLDMVEMMNEQAIPNADYIMQDAGLNFEPCAEGEIYMICQGTGGGYGDVLERDPALVMKDVEENLLSPALAREIYAVEFDPKTLALDEERTDAVRIAERKARIARGQPFDEFCRAWVKDEPADALPYMGSWGDDTEETISTPPGSVRRWINSSEMTGTLLSNPKDRRIAELEAEVARLNSATR
ncbi:MAG: hydantoinase B/oxoprolinase family protein [Pseudomonadota bacterium]|nr:hydantoinase B/oxoprolinase family protein [Pseudomonadota bacterium]